MCPLVRDIRKFQRDLDKFFTVHEGADVILTRNLAMKRFKLTEDEYNIALQAWQVRTQPKP